MPRLSVVTLAKNNEDVIEETLQRGLFFSDELIVVDTGSTDRTREIAQKAGAKVIEYDGEFDYSSARNFGTAACEGDWVFHLDSDERLDPGQRTYLHRFLDTIHYSVLNIRQHNYLDGEFLHIAQQPRIFRNGLFHHEGLVAEWLYPIREALSLDVSVANLSKSGDESLHTDLLTREFYSLLKSEKPTDLEGLMTRMSRLSHLAPHFSFEDDDSTYNLVYAEVLSCFNKITEIQIIYPLNHVLTAACLATLDKKEEAYNIIDILPRVFWSNPTYYSIWADLHYCITKDASGSLEALDEAEAIHPFSQHMGIKAEILRLEGRTDEEKDVKAKMMDIFKDTSSAEDMLDYINPNFFID